MAASEGSPSQAPRPRWLSTELGTRAISALVLGILALAAAFAGGWLFVLFWLAAGIAVACEWIAVSRCEPRLPLQVLLGGGLAALSVLYLGGVTLGVAFLVALLVSALVVVVARRPRDRLWAASGFFYALVICVVPPLVRDRPDLGLVGLLWMFAVVWTADVAAYFTGRRLGGPKLWPRISPKKTWSGFLGGVLAGTVSGLLVAAAGQEFGWVAPAGFAATAIASAVAAVASQVGDLGESALKRRFDVKDSSHIIPGHGGVMDRLDGFWAVAALTGIALLGARALPA
jgi:phosphatidate cytidylyltransferase